MNRPSAVARLRTLFLRRTYTSKPPTTPPPVQNSVPGPGWTWTQPFIAPFRGYSRMQARSPYLTQLCSSLTIYFCGDLSAQLLAGDGSDYAPERGLRAMAIGGIAAIPVYHWFLFLGRHFNYASHTLSIAVKILLGQCVFAPTFNSYFFAMQSLLSGNGWEETKRRVVNTVPISWVNGWKFWPAVTAFTFTFVRPQFRSVTAGGFAVTWQTYLSWLNGRAATIEGAKDAGRLVKAAA